MPHAPRPRTVFILLTLAAATTAAAQEPVRLEFRIVPTAGMVGTFDPAGVYNLPLTTPASPLVLSGVGLTQRFNLQYRVLDLNPADAEFVPAGLSAASINITLGNMGAGTLDRSHLTRFQAQLASTIPPPNPDTTGITSSPNQRYGMNAPFRGGFSDQNNNTLPANGTLVPNGIVNILPLSISQNNQGNANNGLDNTAWYGLYSFDFIPNPNFTGLVSITAEATADPGTGNRFGWFNDGIAVPVQSSNATPGAAYIAIIPAPSAAAIPLLGLALATRRRRDKVTR